jgi:hypothetical protein
MNVRCGTLMAQDAGYRDSSGTSLRHNRPRLQSFAKDNEFSTNSVAN